MAKRRGKKKAAKSARRPKPAFARAAAGRPAKKAKKSKKAVRRAARKPARRAPARPAARKPVKKKTAARKPVRKPSKKKAAPKKQAARKPVSKAPASAKATAGKGASSIAAAPKKLPNLDRERKRLADAEIVPSAPSTLGYEGGASAARSGRTGMREALTQHTETGPALTGGDVDADWEDAYAVGDEAPGGDNPTPDQDRVDDIGKALGVQYEDNEELKGAEKIIDRDRKRWELDPASSDDYIDRKRDED
jgi:hypothetical protein